MKITSKNLNLYKIFAYFTLYWIVFGWLAYFATIFSFFYCYLFIAYLALGAFFLVKYRQSFKILLNWKILGFLAGIILFLSLFILPHEPTVFTGRDQGTLAQAAVNIYSSHGLHYKTNASMEFFRIYEAGKALNYPGFYYATDGSLIPHFPLGYISFLAGFYAIFGLTGFKIANIVCLFIFIVSLYFLADILINRKIANWLLAFLLTSFSFSWIGKSTLSENFALALIWFSIFLLTLFFLLVQNKKLKQKEINFYYLSIFLSLTLLVITRIEGIALLIVALALIIFFKKTFKALKSIPKKYLIISVAGFVAIYLINLYVNFPFFKEVAKAILKTSGSGSSSGIFDKITFRISVFYLYGLIGFFLLGIAGIAKKIKQKSHINLIPLLIVLPTFIYLISPHVSADHPWMLRRFIFTLLPCFMLYSLFVLNFWLYKKKIFFYALTIGLIFLNLTSFTQYLAFSENQGLLNQTQKISQYFSENDLILIDQKASGDGFSMLAGPLDFLYGKNAVYFINPADYAKINKDEFDNIYLITPEENISKYQKAYTGQLALIDDYQLTSRRFSDIENPLRLPPVVNFITYGKIYKIN